LNSIHSKENAMKRLKWVPLLMVVVLSTWLLDGCSFSVQVLSTPLASEPTVTQTSVPFTPTAVPPTAILPSATPTLIPIRVDTIPMIEIFNSLELQESVRSLAFTPDGSVLAAAGGDSEDFVIHVWDVRTGGQAIGTLSGHSGIIWGVAFSPDGQMLASVSSDGTAKIWDWRSGDLLKTLDFPDQVGSVSFSPDGQTLAVGGLDELQSLRAAIWIFSTGSWQSLLKIPEYVNITALSYSPNGRWLVGGGASRNVQVWRTSDGTSVFTLNHAHQVLDAAVSPDSSTAATATCGITLNDQCTEGSIWLWDLSTGKLINRLADFPDVVESVAFSVDGSSLIATSRDGTLRVYDTVNYEPQYEADPPGGNGVMALSPDGGLLATGGANGEVRLWKVVYRP
jgi:WD40 repeat protein